MTTKDIAHRYRKIAERLAATIGDRTMTQGQLAALLECSRPSICQAVKLLRREGRIHIVKHTASRRNPQMLLRLGSHDDAAPPSTGDVLLAERTALLLGHLSESDLTASELAGKTGLSRKTVIGTMAAIRKNGQAHVASTRGDLQREYIYRAGPGEDDPVVAKARPAASEARRKRRIPATIPSADPLVSALFDR